MPGTDALEVPGPGDKHGAGEGLAQPDPPPPAEGPTPALVHVVLTQEPAGTSPGTHASLRAENISTHTTDLFLMYT